MKLKTMVTSVGLLAMLGAPAAMASDQPGALASQWFEEFSGGADHATDAGNMIASANLTRGEGPLTEIRGSLVNTRDVDVFCIQITNPASFSAVVPGTGGTQDTNLMLFNPAGNGIAFNDNNPNGIGVGSALSSTFTANLTPGLYFLAINRNDVSGFGSNFDYPLSTNNTQMFAPALRTDEVGPVNAADVLGGWSFQPAPGFGNLFNYNYTITLTGAGFHQLPAPGALALLGLGGIVAGRRRR